MIDTFYSLLFIWIHHFLSITHNRPLQYIVKLDCVHTIVEILIVYEVIDCRDGNGAGRVQGMRFLPLPCIILFYPIPAPSRMMGKIFLSHPCPLGPHKAPPHLVKLYFMLICLQLLQLFLIKLITLIKIYLKL